MHVVSSGLFSNVADAGIVSMVWDSIHRVAVRAERELALPFSSHLRYYRYMAKSIKEIPKKRGRPATGKDPLVTVRLPMEMIAALDAKAGAAGATRSVIIRELIGAGLKAKDKPR